MKRFNKFLALFLVVVMTAGQLVTGVSATSTEETTSDPNVIHSESFEDWVGEGWVAPEILTYVESANTYNTTNETHKVYWNGATPTSSQYTMFVGTASAVLVPSVGNAKDGNVCIKLAPKAESAGRITLVYRFTDDQKNAFEDGAVYTIGFWCKTEEDTTFNPYMEHYLTAKAANAELVGDEIRGSTTYDVTDGKWVFYEYTFTAHKSDIALESNARVSFGFSQAKKAGAMYIDGIIVTKKTVSIDETASVFVGESKTLTAVQTPAATNSTLTWTSNNENVATVDQNGKVTAVSAGEAVITATADGMVYDTCAVTVKNQMTYEELTNALNSNTEVMLPTNVNGTGNDLVLKSGKTLDLAGNTLTVDSLSALKGANVIDSVGGGKLVVYDGVSLDKGNTYVPVKDGNGYVFYQAFANTSEKAGLTAGVNSLSYADKPTLKTNEQGENVANDLFANGAADNGISLVYRLSWTVEGKTVTMDVALSDAEIIEAHTLNAENQYSLIKLTATNVVDGATVSTVLVSDLGVEYVVNTATYTAVTE